jgi:hypothetical protein
VATLTKVTLRKPGLQPPPPLATVLAKNGAARRAWGALPGRARSSGLEAQPPSTGAGPYSTPVPPS